MSHLDKLPPEAPTITNLSTEDQLWLYENFSLIKAVLNSEVNTTFTTVDSKTVTVVNGIITNVV